MNSPRTFAGQQAIRPPQGWLRLVVMAVLLAVFLYSAWQRQKDETRLPGPASSGQPRPEVASGPVVANEIDAPEAAPATTTSAAKQEAATRTIISSQTIRNEDGKVVFRGNVDVGATLARIERGERLRFSNDGSTFQNRERRLPSKPGGYYKEFVHPTPGLGGPGPQRIVTGRDGEIYYTPDHYRSFQRLDAP